MAWLAIAALAAGLSAAPVDSTPATAGLDSVGVPAERVPRAARNAIDAFMHGRELLPGAGMPERYRQAEVAPRTYFLDDLDGDGTLDVAVIYDLGSGMADDLWLLFAMGPRFRTILHAQVGTRGRARSRYARLRGLRHGRFEFDTLYYEPGAPMCCPSVPGWSYYSYWCGDIVESETIIDWARRLPPGEVPLSPWR